MSRSYNPDMHVCPDIPIPVTVPGMFQREENHLEGQVEIGSVLAGDQ